ncbi:MAG: hemolysin III family protein [Spirochaetaceae bacterium]|nr:MAG: hemolysin III family protein [Spirochaetaceae bacterium]
MIQEKPPRELRPSEIRYESGGAIEEIFNSLTHAIGIGLSIAGLTVLMLLTRGDPSPWKYAGFIVYGVSQILLYTSSALMHSFAALPRIRYYLRIVDQCFIYLLIAGTYTPVILVGMRTVAGWTVFAIVWTLAIAGIILKATIFRTPHIISDLLYLPMGWTLIVAIRPMIRTLPEGLLFWMLLGGLCYTGGVVFYAWRRLPFGHMVWHLAVLAGSVSFFLGFSLHLAQNA